MYAGLVLLEVLVVGAVGSAQCGVAVEADNSLAEGEATIKLTLGVSSCGALQLQLARDAFRSRLARFAELRP